MAYPMSKDDRVRLRWEVGTAAAEAAHANAIIKRTSINCRNARTREGLTGVVEPVPHCKNTGESCLCECHDA